MTLSRTKETLMKLLFGACAITAIVAIVMICLFLVVKAWPAFSEIGVFNFLFGQTWKPSSNEFGIFPMILSTIYVSGLALLMGAPLGIGCAVFLVYYCPKQMKKWLKRAVDLLAGIPSVVYGFFALMVLVPMLQNLTGTNGKGLFTAGLILAIMILPTIVSVTYSSLSGADSSVYEGSLALGATKEQSVYKAVFAQCKSGIMTAIILGLGRAMGETMAVMMVAGNAARVPDGLFANVRTLTSNIVLEMGYAPEGIHQDALIATAVVLMALILVVNLCFQIIREKEMKA